MDDYHRQTRHTLASVRSGHGMNWNLQPEIFKRYPQEFATIALDILPALGDFSAITGYLCLEQALGAESAATVFLVGQCENYLPLMLKAGLVGQRIYLASTLLGFGCSGIGAFYDQEVADFLETDDPVLYALAFGR